ncbi:MAG: GFA family protein [Gammaproteobacteria bacterium]|nr:GFA family protein [Gammaproteobacteria bacterium]
MASGHCLCGRIRFVTEGEPQWVAYCHCPSCRRHSGAPVACFVNFPLERVRFEGEPARYASSPGVTRSHCAHCGTSIAYETAGRRGEIDLYLSAFAEPERFEPQAHVYFGERLPWFDTRDRLPRAAVSEFPPTPPGRLAGFIIDCQNADLQAAAAFWSAALGMPMRQLPDEEGGKYVRLVDAGGLHIEVQAVDHPSRVHLDIASEDVEAEVRRLEALGATRVAQVHSWWVMEAPTGQRFCVVRAVLP